MKKKHQFLFVLFAILSKTAYFWQQNIKKGFC